MVQKFFQRFSLGLIVWVFAFSLVFAGPALGQDTKERFLTVHLQGVFSAKVSLMPFTRVKAIKPLAEVPDVLEGKTAVIKILAQYLPGEFLLRLDYRAKETDSPYPAERIIYINKQDVEVFINPLSGDTKFGADEKENTVYSAFMKDNGPKRMPINLLRQFLLSYDRPKSKLYTRAVNEFRQRGLEYNVWLSDQAKTYRELYVSRLFQFQYIPDMPRAAWKGSEDERLGRILKNYFEGINFSDPLIIRSRELSTFMDSYIRLYGIQAKTLELRDSLFTQAGSAACEKASQGHPEIYGWMVDYFYKGYETYHIDKGMAMLEKHSNNPNCLTSRKQQIIKRLEGTAKLIPGSLAPGFIISDNEGGNFEFHRWIGKAKYKLLLFWSIGCKPCRQLVKGLRQWYNEPVNKEKLDIVAVCLNGTKERVWKRKAAVVKLSGWKLLYAKEGINSPVANDYAVLSTPAMFLIESESNIIVSLPGNLEQLINDL